MLQKKYEDYTEDLYKKYPDIETDCIDDIVKAGLKSIYEYIKNSGDVLLKDQSSFIFIGSQTKQGLKQWLNSTNKEHTKKRVMFLQSKAIWDGWYYLGLTEEENHEFETNGFYLNVTLYRLSNECDIRKNIKYIYRTKLKHSELGDKISWLKKKEKYYLKNCELFKIK